MRSPAFRRSHRLIVLPSPLKPPIESAQRHHAVPLRIQRLLLESDRHFVERPRRSENHRDRDELADQFSDIHVSVPSVSWLAFFDSSADTIEVRRLDSGEVGRHRTALDVFVHDAPLPERLECPHRRGGMKTAVALGQELPIASDVAAIDVFESRLFDPRRLEEVDVPKWDAGEAKVADEPEAVARRLPQAHPSPFKALVEESVNHQCQVHTIISCGNDLWPRSPRVAAYPRREKIGALVGRLRCLETAEALAKS